jgi:microcystin-dependent protein
MYIVIILIIIFYLIFKNNSNYIEHFAELSNTNAIRFISLGAKDLIDTSTLSGASNININGTLLSNGAELLPIGYIMAFAGTVIPPGWALCDGINGRPNLNGRTIVGVGPGKGLNSAGGAVKVQITEPQMPIHTHTTTPANPATHTHTHYRPSGSCKGGGANNCSVWSGSTSRVTDSITDRPGGPNPPPPPITHTHTVSNTGGGEGHYNMQPYIVLNYIIKII